MLTPERWAEISELFERASDLDLPERERWLRAACGVDDALRLEVTKLLEQDECTRRDGFLAPPTPSPARGAAREPSDSSLIFHLAGDSAERVEPGAQPRRDRFVRRAAISAGQTFHSLAETEALVRERLPEFLVIYVIIVAMRATYGFVVHRHASLRVPLLHLVALAALIVLVGVLWSRRPLSLLWLRRMELAAVGLVAALLCYTQYYNMYRFSVLGEPMTAWSSLKNSVLVTAVLIVTFGLYVPKGWRRAAAVGFALAAAPFATLMAVYWGYPQETAWLTIAWMDGEASPLWMATFDALLLAILAAGSAYGAHMISRLRRQVVEARQLGQYTLKRKLGAGGMGEVYLAEHQLLKRPCALKLIRPGTTTDEGALELFEREVRLTATLSHWNVIEIFDYGRTEDGTYYYVMEYLPGLSLAELVERHGPLAPGRVVYLVRQVCLALREAHAAGLIHRDIKPSNIFAARRGGMDDVAKLLDFGLVQPAPVPAAASAASGEAEPIRGTPHFMSPEQARGIQHVDERSDIYSLGAVAYYMLTARPPFDTPSHIGALIAHAQQPVPPPSRARPDIPADLEAVILRCLAKAPADRFADAMALADALSACQCAGDWDPERAAEWWRHREPSSAQPGAVAEAQSRADIQTPHSRPRGPSPTNEASRP